MSHTTVPQPQSALPGCSVRKPPECPRCSPVNSNDVVARRWNTTWNGQPLTIDGNESIGLDSYYALTDDVLFGQYEVSQLSCSNRAGMHRDWPGISGV